MKYFGYLDATGDDERSVEDVIKEVARLAEPIFVANNWTYRDDKFPPTQGKLCELIQELVDECTSGYESATTGRFIVSKHTEKDEAGEAMDAPEITISLDLGHIYGREK